MDMQNVTEISDSRNGVALYGGAFDPVHVGHLRIAELALAVSGIEQVVFIPAAQSPLKSHGAVASDEERLAMLRLATAGNSRFVVDDYELKKGGVSYSVETARQFKSDEPNRPVYWILGADQFEQLDRWRSVDQLCELVVFLVFRRAGHSVEMPTIDAELQYELLDAPLLPQNSTEIRRRFAAGDELGTWLTPAVEAFISQQELYK